MDTERKTNAVKCTWRTGLNEVESNYFIICIVDFIMLNAIKGYQIIKVLIIQIMTKAPK